MTEPETISIISHPSMAWTAIKESFSSFVHLKMGDGVAELTKLGSDVFGGVVAGISGYLVYDILSNKNTKWYQKIIPATFVGIGLGLAVPATVAVIIGASTLVPPFMFVASVGATYRSASVYLQDRAERNNLRKEMIKRSEIDEKIHILNLSATNKKIVNDYLDNTTKIYNKLYQLRKDIIINLEISAESKKILIDEINHAIEKCSQDKNKGNIANIKLSMHLLPEEMRQTTQEQLDQLKDLTKNYNTACGEIKKIISPSSSLLKLMNAYKITHEKIFSQDLPEQAKAKIVALLEKEKIEKDELKLLYSQLGNHYLNLTADRQIHVQDLDFNSYLTEEDINDNQHEIIKKYYQPPREIFSKINKLKISLIENGLIKSEEYRLISEFLQNAVNNPDLFSIEEWSNLESSLKNSSTVTKQKLNEIQLLIHDYSNCVTTFSNLRLKENFEENKAIQSEIKQHRESTLVQFSNLGLQFSSPKIDFSLSSNDLIHRAKRIITSPKDKIAAEFTNESEIAIDEQIESMSDKTKAHKNAKELKADFKKKFENTFNVIEKKQRLVFLEKTVPRRLANVFLSFGVATLSLATTIAIPAIASPAAPIAATAATVLGAISATLTVISLANSVDIIRRDFSSSAKVGMVRHEAKEGIVPSRKWEKKKNAEYKKELVEKEQNSDKHRKEPLIMKKVRFDDEEVKLTSKSESETEKENGSIKFEKK